MGITGITSHIYPLCKYPDEYYEGVTPEIEEAAKGNVLVNAFQLTMATAAGADTMTVIFGCGFGIMTIIFFGTFLASLYSTKIKVKFQDLLLLWAERTALTILIWGFIARILLR